MKYVIKVRGYKATEGNFGAEYLVDQDELQDAIESIRADWLAYVDEDDVFDMTIGRYSEE